MMLDLVAFMQSSLLHSERLFQHPLVGHDSGWSLGPARTHPSPQAVLARKSKIAQTSSKHHGPGTSVTPCFSCRSLQFPPQTTPHSNLIKIVCIRDGHFTGNAKKATIGISPNIRRFDT